MLGISCIIVVYYATAVAVKIMSKIQKILHEIPGRRCGNKVEHLWCGFYFVLRLVRLMWQSLIGDVDINLVGCIVIWLLLSLLF